MCFKLGQLSGISIVDKERPFSYAAVLLLFVVVVVVGVVVVVVVVVVGGGGGVCFKLGQLSGISIVDKERPFSYAAVLLLLLLLLLLLVLLLGNSFVDKERFSYAAVLLLLLLLLLLLVLLLLFLLAVGGVCFKLGQLSGISIVDKERL